MFQVTEQRLVDQANQIQKKKWLSDIELEEIKRNIEDIPHGEAVNEQRVETEGMDEQEHEILGNTDISQNPDDGEVDRDERYFVGDDEGNTIQIREGQILNEEDESTVCRTREILQEKRQCLPSLRGVDRMKLKTTVQEVGKVLAKVKGNNVTRTNNIIYTGAKVAIEKLRIKSGKRAKKGPWWKRRLENEVKEFNRDLGRINAMFKKGRSKRNTRHNYRKNIRLG